jgi:hypothetical protein
VPAAMVFGLSGRPRLRSVEVVRCSRMLRRVWCCLPSSWLVGRRRIQYGRASETVARTRNTDPAALWQMAVAVAVAWRQIASRQQLPWWLLAAVDSAAQAFEAQSLEWEARHLEASRSTGGDHRERD